MTTRDTIARVLFDEGGADEHVRSYGIADALITAIRAMPPEDQAELIGGAVNRDRDLSTNRPIARVVGIWRDQR